MTYDPESNVVVLDGPGGASVMLGFLLKAKFGDALDHEVLFHAPLAELMSSLAARGLLPGLTSTEPFNREMLMTIADAIVDESGRLGLWRMSRDKRVDFIQEVVAAPYRLSDVDVTFVLDAIDDILDRSRRIVQAADANGQPE